MSPEAKAKPKSSETKRKAAGEGGEELHPDACLVCRELKSKEDKQNKMIGNDNAMTITSLNLFNLGCDGPCGWWFHWSCIGMTT